MAWWFDESNDRVVLSDHSALSLPSGDWTVALWLRPDDLTGSSYQYFLSWGAFNASPSMALFLVERSAALNKGSMKLIVKDSSGLGVTSEEEWFSDWYGASGDIDWSHMCFVRSGSDVFSYKDGIQVSSNGVAGMGAVDVSAGMYLGARNDLDSARYFGGSLAEFGKWDRALSANEIAGLAAGAAPIIYGNSLAYYLPMVRGYTEDLNPLTVTNTGSIPAAHPRIIRPSAIVYSFPSSGAAPTFKAAWARGANTIIFGAVHA